MYFQKQKDTAIFTEQQVREWFKNFSSEIIEYYYVIPRGYENTSIVIKTAGKKYVLRHSVISINDDHLNKIDEKLREEIAFMIFLKEKNQIPNIYYPINTKDAFVAYHSKKEYTYLLLMDFVEGYHKNYNHSMLKSVAKLMKNLHRDSLKYPINSKNHKNHSAFSYRINNKMEDVPGLSSVDELYQKYFSLYETIRNELELFASKEEKIMIHNDIKRDNVLFVKDQVSGLVDFGDCRISIKEEDLGCVIWDLCDKLARKKWDFKPYVLSFLKEYGSQNSLFKLENAKMAINFAIDRYLLINLHYLKFNQYSTELIKYQTKKALFQLEIIYQLIQIRDRLKI